MSVSLNPRIVDAWFAFSRAGRRTRFSKSSLVIFLFDTGGMGTGSVFYRERIRVEGPPNADSRDLHNLGDSLRIPTAISDSPNVFSLTVVDLQSEIFANSAAYDILTRKS